MAAPICKLAHSIHALRTTPEALRETIMPIDQEAASAVLARIDPDELSQLACDLVSIPSPTGQEQAIADYILDWCRANGLKTVRQEVEVDRPNAVGIVKGDGTGLSLMFNGHLDTSYTGTAEDLRMIAHVEPESELRGSIADGKVRGLGISNMKGGVAAFLMAGAALQRSGVPLKGDAICAAVVGEISRTPIGPWQTKEYRGEGAGTRHLLTHGIQSDYAVVADGSDMNIPALALWPDYRRQLVAKGIRPDAKLSQAPPYCAAAMNIVVNEPS